MRRLPLLFVCCLLFPAHRLFAQAANDEYYVTFEEQVTARLSLSKKYTSLILKAPAGIQSIHYRPNSLTSLGINASYKALSLGIGASFGFLNPNKSVKGKTRSFDLQTHIYTRDWVTDIYGQFYKGYYLKQDGPAGTADKVYYLRPDMRVNMLGASVYRLLNGGEFSYRAGFLQNEWQKKSAGSLLIGAEMYYGSTKGDSALVPSQVKGFYPQRDIKRVRLFEVGPGAGYAYTGVWEENFFATGSITVNANLSIVKEENELTALSASRTTITPNATLRAVAGYNSDEWAATISWVHNSTNAKGKSSNEPYSVRTGEFRVTLAFRFMPGSKLKGRLDPILRKM
jgi:Domain of unknown function (DUF4421)